MATAHGAIPRDALTIAVINGGAAGALTVTGIKTRDTLVSVVQVSAGVPADLTSEFSISAADTIDNTGGTATTGDKLIVFYLSVG